MQGSQKRLPILFCQVAVLVAVLLAEVIILFILAFLPNRTPDFWITVPITFAASMQVLTFRTVGPHTYTSTFTTGKPTSSAVLMCKRHGTPFLFVVSTVLPF
jgi:uncharacterized membrane protein YoaK (UPF0700 family)